MQIRQTGLFATLFLQIAFIKFAMSDTKDAKIVKLENGNLASIDDCLYVYVTNGMVAWPFKEPDQLKTQQLGGATLSGQGDCTSGNTTKASSITLVWTWNNGESIKLLNLELSLSEPDQVTSYWKVDSAVATMKVKDDDEEEINVSFDLKSEFPMTAPNHYSFSCSGLEFTNVTKKDKDKEVFVGHITINQIQIQGFSSEQVFVESYDCQPWFTLSLWMGLLVTLFLATLLGLGLCFLSSIQTNDRMEDAKYSKPLHIPNTD